MHTDIVVRDVLNILDHGAEGVAMSCDDDVLALLDEGQDLLVVVGPDTLRGELERLAAGRGDIVAAAPDVHLVLAPLLARVVLVEARELAVVALVESLVLVDRNVLLTNLLELDAQRSLRALQSRGEGHVKLDARRSNTLSTRKRLLATKLRQRRILPAREEVELVPLGLTVARKDESSNHFGNEEEKMMVGEVGRYARKAQEKKGGPNALALEFRSSEHLIQTDSRAISRVGLVSRLFHGYRSVRLGRGLPSTGFAAGSPKKQRHSARACIRPVGASPPCYAEMMLSEGMAVPAPCAM